MKSCSKQEIEKQIRTTMQICGCLQQKKEDKKQKYVRVKCEVQEIQNDRDVGEWEKET